jgi:hypothetical protein
MYTLLSAAATNSEYTARSPVPGLIFIGLALIIWLPIRLYKKNRPLFRIIFVVIGGALLVLFAPKLARWLRHQYAAVRRELDRDDDRIDGESDESGDGQPGDDLYRARRRRSDGR